MAGRDSIDSYVKSYREKLDYLQAAYKNPEKKEFLDNQLIERRKGWLVDFGQFLKEAEHEYECDLRDLEKFKFPKSSFMYSYKRDVSLFSDDLKEHLGEEPSQSRKIWNMESHLVWNKPYLKKIVGKPYDKDFDFYSIDINYSFKSTTTKDEAKDIYMDNRTEFLNGSIDSAYERLQKAAKYRIIPKEYLEVKKVFYRSGFKELIITVGLKKSILELKEKIQEEGIS